MNLPNILSVFRLVLTVFFIISINRGEMRLALGLFILQGVSDLLDGFLARVMGKKTELGAFLDPLADKVMLVSAYLVLAFHRIIPFWVTGVVLSRDLVISLGFLFLYRRSLVIKVVPSILGKLTTGFQIITIVYVLWSEARPYCIYLFYVTIFFTIASGAQYVHRGIQYLRSGRIAHDGV